MAGFTPGCGPNLEWSAVETMVRTSFPEVEQISTDSLAALLADSTRAVTLLDVRTAEEYAVSRIPGAIHVDPDAVELPAEATGLLVAYCSVGYRSSQLAERLETEARIVNLEGSIFRWANEGRPVEGSGGKVHTYDRTWGRLLKPELRAD
ncbi:MAG: rhodanese-like domain-containing protein [Rhodothermales bacterium]|nr:rhodanese-like domain-containing protein [Rhodothermales bacterium]MBO6778433.1 rhodanese-like domain-containing protein [Rhodothermales bacterium]